MSNTFLKISELTENKGIYANCPLMKSGLYGPQASTYVTHISS